MEDQPQHDPLMGEKLWESDPKVEGLSDEENSEVYNGNTENVANRIKSIPDANERDKVIQEMVSSIGSRLRELAGVMEIAETEWKKPEKVEEYQQSMDNLDKLNNELLSLHQGE